MGFLYRDLQLLLGEEPGSRTPVHFDSITLSRALKLRTLTQMRYRAFLERSSNFPSSGVQKVSKLPSVSSQSPTSAVTRNSGNSPSKLSRCND